MSILYIYIYINVFVSKNYFLKVIIITILNIIKIKNKDQICI